MKIQKPQQSTKQAENDDLDEAISYHQREEIDIVCSVFKNETLEHLDGSHLEFRDCTFINCKLTACDFSKSSFVDCVFEFCDFSNSSFPFATFQRVRMKGCKLMGCLATKIILQNTTFLECNGRYMNFAQGKFKSVAFCASFLDHASFAQCSLNVSFENTSLLGVDFLHTSLNKLDFTTCLLDGIVLSGEEELKGAIVTSLQAGDLARFLGVVIKDAQ